MGRFIGESQLRWMFQPNKQQYGEWFRQSLTDMGPAFIKLGQFLSTRPDILGKQVAAELSRLQDDITPVHYNDVIHVIERTLKKPWSDVFLYIEPTSIASASIGQVHKARLRSGKDVVVKVQKPHVAQIIRDDLETLQGLNKWFARTGTHQSTEIDQILKEYSRFLRAELDYEKEIAHMIRFSELMDGLPVKIPFVYKEVSNPSMIVMEYVPSTKITDVDALKQKGIETDRVAQTLLQVFIHQVIYNGLVHCDPHPGNLGVAEDGETIVLYDFGNVVDLSSEFRKELNHMLYSIVAKDVDEFVDLLEQLQILEIKDPLEIIEVKEFFRYFFSYLETLDFNTLRNSVLQQGMQGGPQVKVKVNPDFLSLFRVFSLLDGTCGKLDPNFNYIEALRPYTEEMMRDMRFWNVRIQKDVQKLRSYPSVIRNTDSNILKMQSRLLSLNRSFMYYQSIMILWIWIDHPNDWAPWIMTMFILGWNQLNKDT